jgi:phosphate transport system substrate-binding protein
MKKSVIAGMVAVLAAVLLFAGKLGTSEAAPAPAPDALLVNAAGATFPYPIYSKWFDSYHKMHPDVQINYQSIGSGGGIRQLQAGTVDFGASDMPLNDELLSKFKEPILQFPTVLGAVVPTYNIPGVHATLKFTPEALAGIYLGKITKWNDSAITGVGSNTSVRWPVGLGGKGNEGVAGIVRQTPNAIGYVELIYALQNHMSYGEVRNSSGDYIKASLASVTAAASGVASQMKKDIRVSITDAPGKTAYPICSFTYLLIPKKIQDPQKAKAIKGFLQWMLHDGQGMVESLNYARLPQAVVGIEMNHLSQVQ